MVDSHPAKTDPQIGVTCEGCDYFAGKCMLQMEIALQINIPFPLFCQKEDVIFVNKIKKDYTQQDIALIVYRCLKRDQIHPIFPPEIAKNITQLLEKTDENRILIERFYSTPIGNDLKRLERHLGSIGGNA